MNPQDLKGKIFSLDIETFGLNEKKYLPFSLGLTGDDYSQETFIDQGRPAQSVIDEVVANDSFQAKQLKKGIFNPLLEAERNGQLKSIEAAVANTFKTIGNNSTVVIQNMKFENDFLGEAISKMGADAISSISENLRFVTPGAKDPSKLLYAPPSVVSARNKARNEFTRYLTDKSSSADQIFAESNRHYREMMGEYKRLIGETAQGKGSIFVELQDVTRALFSEAAINKHIDKAYSEIGLSVDFLTKTLFSRDEKHAALSDAVDQKELFHKLTSMYDELRSGTPSAETVASLAKIKKLQPYDVSRQFLSAMRNAFQEIEEKGGTKTMLRSPSAMKETAVDVLDRATGQKQRISVADYRNSQPRTDPGLAIDSVMSRYEHFGHLKGIDKDGIKTHLLSLASNRERIGYLEKLADQQTDNIASKLAGQTSLRQEAKDIAGTVKHTISRLTPTQKKMAIASAGALAFMGMASVGDDKESKQKLEQLNERREYRSALKSAMDMYSKPQVYHGTALYNWNNANRHHEY